MEFMVDYDIKGEVLIPLENGKFLDGKENITIHDINQCSYFQFRNVLFQGELIKMYIVLQCDNKNISIFDNFFFKIDFESAEIDNININKEMKDIQLILDSNDIEKAKNDLFTINTKNINEKNFEYEKVSHKEYDEDSNTEVYELFKQIIVPENFLNKCLILKLELMMKNEDCIDFKENFDALKYYQTGHYKNINRFTIFKTFYKEIKIIRPLSISNTKQADLTVETSLLQIKIENTTANINFIDNSLKTSKYLKKEEIKNEDKSITQKLGNLMVINEIQLLEDETTINEALTNNIKTIKEIFMKNDKVSMENITFNLFENKFPLNLFPGEEYHLTVKLVKNAFLNEKTDLINVLENYVEEVPESSNNKNKDYLKTEISGGTITVNRQLSTNRLGLNIPEGLGKNPNIQYSQTITDFDSGTKLNRNSIVVRRKTQFKLNKITNEERLSALNNIGTPIYTENSLGGIQKNIFGKMNEEKDDEEQYSNFIGDENIKIFFATPVILYVSSSMFYEDLFICLQIKWVNEINRFLKIELSLPKDIIINEYFSVRVKIRNVSSVPMNLFIEVKEDDTSDVSLEKIMRNIEPMPAIISSTKFETLGMFNCNEDKLIDLNFLAIKLGVTKLPNFAITDTLSNRRFYFVPSNKIIIQENKNQKNVLNRFISMNI